MKLVLKEKQPDGRFQPSRWTFEHGKRMLGRSNECDWQIVDGERRVSKLHCTLVREGQRFSIIDQSANGTMVDGRLLLEGQSAPLNNGSRIDIGSQTFEVAIMGEPDMDFGDPDQALRVSDEQLTISAILSDIAPAGRSASGVLGNAIANDDWPDDINHSVPKRGKSISRNVEIGWSGPPSPTGIGAILPDDWNEEPAESSRHEHTDALNTPVKVSRPVTQARDDFDTIFTEPDQVLGAEPVESVALPSNRALTELISQLEKAYADSLAALGIEDELDDHIEHASLAARLETLVRQQRLLSNSLDNLMRVSTQRLEPRLLEAKADLGNDLRAKIERKDWRGILSGPDYWAFYKRQFEENGRQLSVQQFLQRAALGEAMELDDTTSKKSQYQGVSKQDEA